MVRAPSSLALVARWLANDVGEGAIFTKQALRAALPQFEQVDRRMRDLRSHGWRIDTNRDDAELEPSELRLVCVGQRPGEPGFQGAPSNRVSSKERLAAISAAEFRCQLCGAQLGDNDESDSGFAQLKVTRVASGLLVVCGLCAQSAPHQARTDAELLETRLARLSVEELHQFHERVTNGRLQTALESAVALAGRISRDVTLSCVNQALKVGTDSNTRTFDFDVGSEE